MVYGNTPGKWSLWATHPHRLGGIAESFATEASADARASDLKRVGYKVETFQSRLDQRAMPGVLAAARPVLLRHA
jgi:hypothetical protein